MRGVVLDGLGLRAASVPVQIGQTVTLTDAEGMFTIEDAPATYDVTVGLPGQNAIYAFQGLQGRGTLLRLSASRLDPAHEWRVTTNVAYTGGHHLAAFGHVIQADDEWSTVSGGTLINTWRGGGNPVIALIALEYDVDANGAPTHYLGMTREDVPFEAGSDQTLTWKPSLQPVVGERTITVDATAPEGAELASASLLMRWLSLGAEGVIATQAMHGASASFVIPVAGDAEVDVEVTAVRGGASVSRRALSLAEGAHVQIALPAPPQITDPPSGAVDVDAKGTLAWSHAGAGVGMAILEPSGDSAGTAPRVRIATANGRARLPGGSSVGVAFPAGATYDLTVYDLPDSRGLEVLAEHGPLDDTGETTSTAAPRTLHVR